MAKKSSYVFGEKIGDAMVSVPVRTQLEAGMLSTLFMLIGLMLLGAYFTIYGAFPWYVKVMMVVNLAAGFIMMLGSLITTFQQYRTIMEAHDLAKEIEEAVKNNKEKGNNINTLKMKGGYDK